MQTFTRGYLLWVITSPKEASFQSLVTPPGNHHEFSRGSNDLMRIQENCLEIYIYTYVYIYIYI